MSFVYGIVPSRRLGRSLGISPIPFKVCNYSCVYCQLGRTLNMTNERKTFFDVNVILGELKEYIKVYGEDVFDVVTIVSEGEPLLFTPLDELIDGIKKMTSRQVVLITNGSLFYREDVRKEVLNCDIIMPTFDAGSDRVFKEINRPYGKITYEMMYNGLLKLRKEFKGQIWLEVMLVKGLNDSHEEILKLKEKIERIKPDRIYVNVPVRPPAEPWVKIPDKENIEYAKQVLNAYSIEKMADGSFLTLHDDYTSVVNILKRHPLMMDDVKRNFKDSEKIVKKLLKDPSIEKYHYNGKVFFRFKKV
ncbi:radical SAM protein [Thermosipho globiformans]|uniref:radical SAM protein n=1 Tax=Thermosipho globiformans TaxID=380685 RepID=UPI000F8F12C4|nr:radical SAM protein [Thermosipho globiformans]